MSARVAACGRRPREVGRASRPCARTSRPRARRCARRSAPRPARSSSASFSSSRSSRCWRSPTGRRAPGRRCGRARSPSRSPAPDPARQLAWPSAVLGATAPPAFLTASQRLGRLGRGRPRGRRTRRSSRGRCAGARRHQVSTSASFQRSTPSTITKRRPIANVIALSAAAPGLGRGLVALEHLGAARPGLLLGQRPQLRAALGEPAVVVAVDQVGGLPGGHGSGEARRSVGGWQLPRRDAQPHRCPSRSVAATCADRAAGRERRRCRMAVGVALADRDRRELRSQAARESREAGVVAAVVGDLQHLDAGSSSAGGDVGLGVGGEQQVEVADRDVGHDRAAVGVAAGGSRRPRRRRPQDAACGSCRARAPGRARGDRPPRRRRRPPARPARASAAVAAVEHEPGRNRCEDRVRRALVVGLRVGDHQRVEAPTPAFRRAGAARPSGGPVSKSTAAPSRLEQRRVALADVEERDDDLARTSAVAGARRRATATPRRRAAGDGDRRDRRPRRARARASRRPRPPRPRSATTSTRHRAP